MKKKITIEDTCCDVCGESCYEKCIVCGKDLCWKCQKTHAKEYNHSVYFSGSNDGVLCNDCGSKKIPKDKIEIVNAYKTIENLRDEYDKWMRNFEFRANKAEQKIKELLCK